MVDAVWTENCGQLKGFPVVRRPATAQKERGMVRRSKGAGMLSTRVITGVGGLFLVNAILLAVQQALNIAPPLI